MFGKKQRPLASRLDRGPLRTMFVITSMHEDYHQTSDSVEKASGEMIE